MGKGVLGGIASFGIFDAGKNGFWKMWLGGILVCGSSLVRICSGGGCLGSVWVVLVL